MAAVETDLYDQLAEYPAAANETIIAENTTQRRFGLRTRFVSAFMALGMVSGAAACDSGGHSGPPSQLEVGASPSDVSAFDHANFASTPSWQQDFSKLPSGPLDSRYWGYDIGVGSPPGWGNQEREYYTNDPANVRIANGVLNIIAMQKAPGYTSARIETKDKVTMLYGKLDAVLKLPEGEGVWPGFWMLPNQNVYGEQDTSASPAQKFLDGGEVDIMEAQGIRPGEVTASAHSFTYNPANNNQRTGTDKVPTSATAFHDYGLDWTPNQLIFLVDGKPYFVVDRKSNDTYKQWPYNRKFYLILNLALGGTLGGPNIDPAALPADLEVKSITYRPYTGKLLKGPQSPSS